MLRLTSISVLATLVLAATADRADAHCQVPCGIYDDAARIEAMREDATTIEKAIANIVELSGKSDAQSANQLVRWITTKEDHASHIIEVVSVYFLTQKVKPVAEDAKGYAEYLAGLADHHAVMVAAMKCKQNADPATVKVLRSALDALATHYSAEGHDH